MQSQCCLTHGSTNRSINVWGTKQHKPSIDAERFQMFTIKIYSFVILQLLTVFQRVSIIFGNIGWPANLISFASSHRVTDSRCIAQYTYHGPCLYCTIWLTLAMQIPDFQQLHLQLVHFPNVPTTQPTGEAWPWWRWHWCGRGDPWRHLRQRRSGGKKSLGKIVIGKVGDWHPCN